MTPFSNPFIIILLVLGLFLLVPAPLAAVPILAWATILQARHRTRNQRIREAVAEQNRIQDERERILAYRAL